MNIRLYYRLMSENRLSIFSLFYISLHLVVSITGFTFWPFTDYPMYGSSHHKDEQIQVLRLQVEYTNNYTEWLQNFMIPHYTSLDVKTFGMNNEYNYDKILNRLTKHRVFERLYEVKKINLIERKLVRLNNSKFELQEKFLTEFYAPSINGENH